MSHQTETVASSEVDPVWLGC